MVKTRCRWLNDVLIFCSARAANAEPFPANAPAVPAVVPAPGPPTHALAHGHHELPPVQQSISLITGEGSLPIIRRILDPDTVKIPRRIGEGSKPIFDREELKEAMRRRFAAEDENPTESGPSQQASSQRVIAIIREPAAGPADSYRPSSRDHEHSGGSSSRTAPPRPSSHHRRSLSPAVRDRERIQNHIDRDVGRKRASPPPGIGLKRDLREEIRERGRGQREHELHGRGRSRSLERARHHGGHPRRSPIRVLRDRPSRSRSHTPPPMPPEIRRQLIERERDLRSKLSRPPKVQDKFENNVR